MLTGLGLRDKIDGGMPSLGIPPGFRHELGQTAWLCQDLGGFARSYLQKLSHLGNLDAFEVRKQLIGDYEALIGGWILGA